MTTRTARRKLVFGYLRLSKEEALRGESSSISTQRQMIANFCEQNGFTLIKTFSDALQLGQLLQHEIQIVFR